MPSQPRSNSEMSTSSAFTLEYGEFYLHSLMNFVSNHSVFSPIHSVISSSTTLLDLLAVHKVTFIGPSIDLCWATGGNWWPAKGPLQAQ